MISCNVVECDATAWERTRRATSRFTWSEFPSTEIISGKVARDHVHVFLSYRPTQDISQVMQWLKGISSRILLQEFPHLRKKFWGRHVWARGYLAVSSGTITDEMMYINEQEGEQIADDSRFPIDNV
jgi:putative transposase